MSVSRFLFFIIILVILITIITYFKLIKTIFFYFTTQKKSLLRSFLEKGFLKKKKGSHIFWMTKINSGSRQRFEFGSLNPTFSKISFEKLLPFILFYVKLKKFVCAFLFLVPSSLSPPPPTNANQALSQPKTFISLKLKNNLCYKTLLKEF